MAGVSDTWTNPLALDLAIDDLYTETVHDGMVSDLLYLYNALFGLPSRGLVAKRLEQFVLNGPVASITFSGIDQTYETLRLTISARSNAASQQDVLYARFNGAAGADYATQTLIADGVAISGGRIATQTEMAWARIPAATSTVGKWGSAEVSLAGYRRTDRWKTYATTGMGVNAGTASPTAEVYAGEWGVIDQPITSITLFLASGGNLAAGTVMTLVGEP